VVRRRYGQPVRLAVTHIVQQSSRADLCLRSHARSKRVEDYMADERHSTELRAPLNGFAELT
jgi:hypothetical protein